MDPLIESRDLVCGYGNIEVVRKLNLVVYSGEVVAMLGPNGAGKTTSLLTLSGYLREISGDLRWRGGSTQLPLHKRARSGLGLVTEERAMFSQLTAAENLRLCRGDADLAYTLFPELARLRSVRAGLLSGGEQQMLSLAMALSRKPLLLLVDELSLGLAPLVVRRLLTAVRAAANAGVGVLLVEQRVQQVLEVADHAYVMQRGIVTHSGTSGEIAGQLDDIVSSYL